MSTDPLLVWRDKFPTLKDSVHMISHSLGAMPAKTIEDLQEFHELWMTRSINAWETWLPEVERAANRIERLLGAPAGTVAMNQNVSTVQALVASCLDYSPERNKIVYSDLNFPSVSYVWKAEERRGAKVHIVETDGVHVDIDKMLAAIDEQTLIVPISHVVFLSSCLQDARAIVKRAHEVGAYVMLDCYQSLGAVPFDVVDLDVDFACGGSVKWLCGGPGAAYLYVQKELLQELEPRQTGWFGHKKPFDFSMPEQDYADGAWRMIGGTPAVAALYQARAGQEIVAEVGVDKIREKSLRLCRRAIELLDENGFSMNCPRDDDRRGNTVIFNFDGAGDVCKELNRRRFFCDHRPGVGIRISPHFYTKDEEIDLLFGEIKKIRS